MDDLVDFLRARLDEAERKQRSRLRLTWKCGDPCVECGHPAEEMSTFVGHGAPQAEFKPCGHAIYDPAALDRYKQPAAAPFVLADIHAKRQQIAHYQRVAAHAETHPDYALAAGACAISLRHMATVYAEHPEYRQEWAP